MKERGRVKTKERERVKTKEKGIDVVELRKRRYETKLIVLFCVLFVVLFALTAGSFGMADELPLEYAIFLFGLVNFNIIILLILSFLIFRNVTKFFSENKLGGKLRKKLVMAFLGFSTIPVTIIFIVSVFYITTFIDRWSNPQLGRALRNAIDISSLYIESIKERNHSLVGQIKEKIVESDQFYFPEDLDDLRRNYKIDAIEYYVGKRALTSISPDVMWEDEFIHVKREDVKNVLERGEERVVVQNHEGQSFVRLLSPMSLHGVSGVLVITSVIPNVIHNHIGHIQAAYGVLQDDRSPLALIEPFYIVILVFVALVVLLSAIWLGLYLAKQWTSPLEELRRATQGLSMGKYARVDFCRGYPEINLLVSSFNEMVDKLEASQRENSEVNESLKKTLSQLDKHSRYIEIIISNVKAGVISLDKSGKIMMINRYAAKLLEVDPEKYLGKNLFNVLDKEALQIIDELLIMMKKYNTKSVEKEFEITLKGRLIPLQMNLFLLNDEEGHELGKVFVFNDLSVLIAAQRSAAWKGVAKKIAHEIKNPLTPIRLSAERLQRKFGPSIEDPAFYDCVKMIMDQVDDLKSLVNEFSRFARLPQSRPLKSSLNRVISEAMMLFIQSHKGVNFIQDIDDSLPDCLFDPEQIRRVVTNLVDNALSATQNVEKPKITVLTEYDKSLNTVRVSVLDNGQGIPPDIMGKIFDPDITTKRHGTGLGLAIVKRLVEDHNGVVRAFNMEHGGAKIVIEFPVVLSTRKIKPSGRRPTSREKISFLYQDIYQDKNQGGEDFA